jgi:hypothetical protein
MARAKEKGRRPKCPWKPPFRVTKRSGPYEPWKVVDSTGEGVTWHGGDKQMAQANCYALNTAYPVSQRKKAKK